MYQLFTDIVLIVHRLSSNYIQIIYQFLTIFLQNIHKFDKDCINFVSRLYTGFVYFLPMNYYE